MLTNNTPSSEVESGGWWESTNSGLSAALGMWEKVENIKGIKSASGQDQQQAMYQPELANGAAIQVDIVPNANDNSGFKVNKELLFVSAGLLGLAFVLRMKGFS